MADSPERANARCSGKAAFARDYRGYCDDVVRIGGVTEAEEESKGRRPEHADHCVG